MGKVRKARQKYHLLLKKSKSLNNLKELETKNEETVNPQLSKDDFFKESENIFAGVNICWDDITKSIPQDFDVRSVVSTKSRKELKEEERHLKKKDKQKLRHERFMQKLDVSRQIMQNLKSKKKKKKKPNQSLAGDMKSLLDALPSLESLAVDPKSKKSDIKTKRKNRGILKAKQRIKQQSDDAKLFKRILDDKTFSKNPLETINQYLKQKIATGM